MASASSASPAARPALLTRAVVTSLSSDLGVRLLAFSGSTTQELYPDRIIAIWERIGLEVEPQGRARIICNGLVVLTSCYDFNGIHGDTLPDGTAHLYRHIYSSMAAGDSLPLAAACTLLGQLEDTLLDAVWVERYRVIGDGLPDDAPASRPLPGAVRQQLVRKMKAAAKYLVPLLIAAASDRGVHSLAELEFRNLIPAMCDEDNWMFNAMSSVAGLMDKLWYVRQFIGDERLINSPHPAPAESSRLVAEIAAIWDKPILRRRLQVARMVTAVLHDQAVLPLATTTDPAQRFIEAGRTANGRPRMVRKLVPLPASAQPTRALNRDMSRLVASFIYRRDAATHAIGLLGGRDQVIESAKRALHKQSIAHMEHRKNKAEATALGLPMNPSSSESDSDEEEAKEQEEDEDEEEAEEEAEDDQGGAGHNPGAMAADDEEEEEFE